MIVRIMGEGQLEVADAELEGLNALDEQIEQAVDAGDLELFQSRLNELHTRVREVGSPLPDDSLQPSDVVLPPPDATLDEVRSLFEADGLIPG